MISDRGMGRRRSDRDRRVPARAGRSAIAAGTVATARATEGHRRAGIRDDVVETTVVVESHGVIDQHFDARRGEYQARSADVDEVVGGVCLARERKQQCGGEQGGSGSHVVRMAQSRMALLAQERNRRDQQGLLVRPVRCVAVEAALAHGSVFEKERTALLRVTLVAGLVDGIRLQQRAGDRAMRLPSRAEWVGTIIWTF